MSMLLVIHGLPPRGPQAAAESKALFDAIYEIAPAHWRVTGDTVLVAAEISPAYLRDHLLRAIRAAGFTPGMLLVLRAEGRAAWHALPEDGEEWLRDSID